MAVPRAKDKKKKSYAKSDLLDAIKTTQYVDLAVMARALHAKGWKQNSIKSFIKSYGLLFQEIADRRQTPQGMIEDCNDIVGLKIPDLFNDILEH